MCDGECVGCMKVCDVKEKNEVVVLNVVDRLTEKGC